MAAVAPCTPPRGPAALSAPSLRRSSSRNPLLNVVSRIINVLPTTQSVETFRFIKLEYDLETGEVVLGNESFTLRQVLESGRENTQLFFGEDPSEGILSVDEVNFARLNVELIVNELKRYFQ